ncbi:MAG: valine--tRNA ligase [Alphaproteobacteria bacterium]
MSYQHRMTPLPAQYDMAATEKKWQRHWLDAKIYAWDANESRENSYVIDTPPPTVSGHLHMGHVFSYTQADFIARYQRMAGKNVFYPMGFDDNGLPTERLVEKTIKKRATDMSREDFIAECMKVSGEARRDFRALFESIALSVDWAQEYHTISEDARRLSQLSFLDLVQKGQCYRATRPFYWDPVDQTAIASAEIVDKELPSHFCDIAFAEEKTGDQLIIGTTRPELLPACVALFYHPEDTRYQHLKGQHAIVPLFGHPVPILEDDTVEPEKGTGLMMCCTFGDDADIQKWEKHKLPTRVVLNKYGKMEFSAMHPHPPAEAGPSHTHTQGEGWGEGVAQILTTLTGKKATNPDPKNRGAREIITQMLTDTGLLLAKKPITHTVKCAERSGAPLEILPSEQWFVRVTDKKDALKARSAECNWHPEWMRVRMEQWIDGLNQDWCISRQRYFGVPFPVWYVYKMKGSTLTLVQDEMRKETFKAPHQTPDEILYATEAVLPANPLSDFPHFRFPPSDYDIQPSHTKGSWTVVSKKNPGEIFSVTGDQDVMDTWATSSISPQLSAGAIDPHPPAGAGPFLSLAEGERTSAARGEGDVPRTTHHASRFSKLFPADLRPQAHEIIRTWAFYTLVKAHLHSDSIPWKNLMISGWCLAEDKSKMSKSKGNIVTPVALIEERGTDAVRYWAATSRLGQDTAFSPDLLKIGKKLVGKLWNATQFAAIHLSKMTEAPRTAATDEAVTELLDAWILSRLAETVAKATEAFEAYEYAVSLDETNRFFWADFCDNYLELIKKRVYNEDGSFTHAQQQSAIRALYYCLEGILKLYAPFVPHVTEELYAHIFAEDYAAKASLHARGMWVRPENYALDEAAIRAGKDAVLILEKIRSKKSDENKSIKYPVQQARFSTQRAYDISTHDRDSIVRDLEGAGNLISPIIWEHTKVDGLANEGMTNADITLASEADAA